MTGPDDTEWERWFAIQSGLCDQVDELIAEKTLGSPALFRLAIHTALIEHLAERMRFDIVLPAGLKDGSARPEEVSTGRMPPEDGGTG